MTRGKNYKKAVKKIDKNKEYPIIEAIDLVTKGDYTKFKGSFELKINVNIDPKDGEQNIRFTTNLPHSTGRVKKVLAFTEKKLDPKAYKTLEIIVGNESTVEDVSSGKLNPGKDFNTVVAEPTFMPKIAKAAKVLGPKGLMPSPKTGTVGDVTKILNSLDSGQIEVRSQPSNTVIHLVLGKTDTKPEDLVENFNTVIEELNKHRPSKVKKTFIESVFVKSTMSPAVKVDLG